MNNPFGNAFYRLGAGQSQQAANQLGQQNMNAFNQNYLTSGFGGQAGAAFKAAQGAQIGRANQALRSQANIGNIMAALQRQLGATGMGLSYSPLMTGTNSSGTSNTTQTTSGTGTWLPQLIGAGLGAATMGLGGLGGMAGGMSAFGAGSGGAIANQGLSNFNSNMMNANSGINWGALAQPPSNAGNLLMNPLAYSYPPPQ